VTASRSLVVDGHRDDMKIVALALALTSGGCTIIGGIVGGSIEPPPHVRTLMIEPKVREYCIAKGGTPQTCPTSVPVGTEPGSRAGNIAVGVLFGLIIDAAVVAIAVDRIHFQLGH
jgi:hypothetical protein